MRCLFAGILLQNTSSQGAKCQVQGDRLAGCGKAQGKRQTQKQKAFNRRGALIYFMQGQPSWGSISIAAV
jgi:hypothetical protein